MQEVYYQRYGYIGLPSKIFKEEPIRIKNSLDFLDLILNAITYNIDHGINFLCLDTSEFSDLNFLKDFEFDEENPKVSKTIE